MGEEGKEKEETTRGLGTRHYIQLKTRVCPESLTSGFGSGSDLDEGTRGGAGGGVLDKGVRLEVLLRFFVQCSVPVQCPMLLYPWRAIVQSQQVPSYPIHPSNLD